MTVLELIIVLTIHLIIPLIGVFLFFKFVAKMKSERIVNPPLIQYFIIFATFGVLLLVILTSIFWKWSGLASLATFYLILGAPVLLGIIALEQFKKRKISKYHNWAFQISALYFIGVPLICLIIFLTKSLWLY